MYFSSVKCYPQVAPPVNHIILFCYIFFLFFSSHGGPSSQDIIMHFYTATTQWQAKESKQHSRKQLFDTFIPFKTCHMLHSHVLCLTSRSVIIRACRSQRVRGSAGAGVIFSYRLCGTSSSCYVLPLLGVSIQFNKQKIYTCNY